MLESAFFGTGRRDAIRNSQLQCDWRQRIYVNEHWREGCRAHIFVILAACACVCASGVQEMAGKKMAAPHQARKVLVPGEPAHVGDDEEHEPGREGLEGLGHHVDLGSEAHGAP